MQKNATGGLPTYTMFTGEGNPYSLSKISLFNGNENLRFWKTAQCNKVQGSDGATFNPYIQQVKTPGLRPTFAVLHSVFTCNQEETLWFFNDQLCRSIPLVFDRKVLSRTLPGFRFVPRPDVFMSPRSYPENDCYCVDETLCAMLGDGMFGVSKCQFNAPIVLSWPHFLGAEERFTRRLEGLRPNADKHGFWFDIQPVTGTTLSAKARMQINIAVKQLPAFEGLSKVHCCITLTLQN